jgi:hypothetical protein
VLQTLKELQLETLNVLPFVYTQYLVMIQYQYVRKNWKMGDLSDSESGQIIGVHLPGVSGTKTIILLGVSRVIVSKVMSAYTNRGKTTSVKTNSGQKSTFTETDHRTSRTVLKNHSTAAQVTELIIHLKDLISTKTGQQGLHKSNTHDRAATAKPLITESNAPMRKRSCHDHKT